ncbi:unnamed protein product [Caenorhabditis angaria]|uniref:Uncharacterized protein n=1 Tax=Caenorhabditis angaria TaxID=860376 RepID=A0A9P1N0U6_9PELO|nr:unnamed protein product [Caenorhabditis angaria]
MSRAEIIENSENLKRDFLESDSNRGFLPISDARFENDQNTKLKFTLENKFLGWRSVSEFYAIFIEVPNFSQIFSAEDGWMFMWQHQICFCN